MFVTANKVNLRRGVHQWEEKDTVQIYLSKEQGLIPLLHVASSWRIHTCQSLSLSLSLSLFCYPFMNSHSFPTVFLSNRHVCVSSSFFSPILSVQPQSHRLYICIDNNIYTIQKKFWITKFLPKFISTISF